MTVLPVFVQHPQRRSLHDEVHARPYEALAAPARLSHLAFTGVAPGSDIEHLAKLFQRHGMDAPPSDVNHLSVAMPGFRLRWERHTEFVTYTFWHAVDAKDTALDDPPACAAVPADWLTELPGHMIVGLHVAVLPYEADRLPGLARQLLDEGSLCGALMADGQLSAYSDFRLQPDGFGRWLVGVHGPLTPRRLGRYVQRLLEIETYRMMALLGLPNARAASRDLSRTEAELVDLSNRVRDADKRDEPALLEQLTRMAGAIENLYASNHARFSASAAYFELVQSRINDLREERTAGLQTLREFMDRRLSPAMQTCAWAERRLRNLSQRVSNTSQLLRTRVEIEQAESQRALLQTMTRRQRVQLLLQSTVEGLSVAAITYYGAGLIAYVTRAAQSYGWPYSVDLTVACAVPLIAVGTWLGLRKLHRRVEAEMRDS